MSAIITGFCGLCLLGGYIIRSEIYLRVNTVYINQLGHFSVYSKEGVDLFYLNPKKYQLTPESLSKIYTIFDEPYFKENIEFSAEYLNGMGLISNGKSSHPFIAKGVDPIQVNKIFDHHLVKKWTKELSINEQGTKLSEAVAVIPESISITKELGELIGLRTPFKQQDQALRTVQLAGRTIYGDLNAVNAFVNLQHTTGMSLAEGTGLLAPIELLKSLYALDGVTNIAVFLKENSTGTGTVVKKLTQRFQESGIKAEVIPYYDERIGQFYVGTMDFLYIMTFFFVLLICSAVGISIVNAMTMGILERSREVGTMRSLGLSIKTIARMFMKEAVLMTLAGVIIGTVITQIIATIVTSLNIRFFPPGIAGSMQFVLTPEYWLCALTSAIMLIISALTGYFVSLKKANSKIIELLTDAGR